MLQTMSALGIATVAGCSDDSGGGTPTPGDGSDGSDGGDGSGGDGADGGDGGGDGSTDTPTETETPQGPPLRETLRVQVNELPAELNFNPWSNATQFGGIYNWFRDFDHVRLLDGERLPSGHTWDIDYRKGGSREFEVPHLVDGMEVESTGPNHTTVRWDINDDGGFTFWDGTDITAEVYDVNQRLGWHLSPNYGKEGWGPVWGVNEEDNKLYMYWGGKPGRDAELRPASGQNPTSIRRWIQPAPFWGTPFHPDFSREWLEKLEDASTEEEHQSLVEELNNTAIGIEQFIENQWGAGPYKIEDPSDFSQESIHLALRDDHPRSDIITVPEIELKVARRDRYRQLLNQGEIDFTRGVVQPDSPPLDRNTLPDNFQQVDTWLEGGGDMLYLNWQNDHIARLGVRRAIFAAVPWDTVRVNGWGDGGSAPIEHFTGCDNTVNRNWFEQDFLEQLHQYPDESDAERATQFMQDAGYQMDGDVWKYEDGTPLELVFVVNNDIDPYLSASQTIQQSLQSFGIRVQLDNVSGNAIPDRLGSDDFDVALLSMNQSSPLFFYGTHDGWFNTGLYAGGSEFFRCNPDEEADKEGKPTTVTVPNEAGALELEGDGESYNLCKDSRRLFAHDTTREEISEIAHRGARFYNYAVPHIPFQQRYSGYVGNVRDFDWPKEGQQVNTTHTHGGGPYQIYGGVVRTAHDDSY